MSEMYQSDDVRLADIGGIPMVFIAGTLEDVAADLRERLADKSRLVVLTANGDAEGATIKVLAISDDYEGDVAAAKEAVVLTKEGMSALFQNDDYPLVFCASLDGGIRYASASFRNFYREETERILRVLGMVIFDAEGKVLGAPTGANTLILYSFGRGHRADFAWTPDKFVEIANDFRGKRVRHSVVGSKALAVVQEGGNAMRVATATSLSHAIGYGSVAFRHTCVLPTGVRELALAVPVRDFPHAFTLFVTTETALLPVRIAFTKGGVLRDFFVESERAIGMDAFLGYGGVVKVVGSTVIFFGEAGITFAPLWEFEPRVRDLLGSAAHG